MQQANLFQLLFFLDTWKTLLTAWQWQTSITVCFLKPRSLFLSITELFIFQKAFQSCVTKDSLCMRLNMVIQVCFSLARAHAHKLMWSNGYWQHSRVVIRVAVLKSYYFWITVLPISSLLLTWVQLNLLHWLSVHSTLGGLCGMD